MRPVVTAAINAEIEQLEAEKRNLDENFLEGDNPRFQAALQNRTEDDGEALTDQLVKDTTCNV